MFILPHNIAVNWLTFLRINYNLCRFSNEMGYEDSLVSKNIYHFVELRIYRKSSKVARKMHI